MNTKQVMVARAIVKVNFYLDMFFFFLYHKETFGKCRNLLHYGGAVHMRCLGPQHVMNVLVTAKNNKWKDMAVRRDDNDMCPRVTATRKGLISPISRFLFVAFHSFSGFFCFLFQNIICLCWLVLGKQQG